MDDIGSGQDRQRDLAQVPRPSIGAIMVECIWLALTRGTMVLVSVAILFGGLLVGVLALLTVVDPPGSALMAWRAMDGYATDARWVPIERISPNLIRAVVAAEDARFCQHGGIDVRELERAFQQVQDGDIARVRGASTISMQVVKNLFLWPGRSLPRKGLELVITPVMETVWTKRRILEVYLNIAEWGPGIYGAEAASRAHFGRSASALTPRQSSLLAALLPNPRYRSARRPGGLTRRYAATIQRRMPSASKFIRCVVAPRKPVKQRAAR
ncbi:MAG TPA: monofunctional biosynthetic peptidoglycan transglycosylase [Hyphomicrobiaceae bacterium]|nr:monofunctional biosynthetic peptidoglycan transglycosylase [Hyphomicrobiaceae bacterium]